MRYAWLAALAALLAPAQVLAQSPQGADAGAGDEAAADPGAGPPGDSDGAGGDEDLPPMFRDPRQLSGLARPEANDPPGRLTVRAVQGAMERTEFGDVRSQFPPGAKIHLIAVSSDGGVKRTTVPLDSGGRAVFDRLKTGSAVTYVALALFPREGAEDRLISRALSLPPQVGMRMILAGEGGDSKKPQVDDLAGFEEPKVPTPEAGTVVVHLVGDTKNVKAVELFEAGGQSPLQTAKVEVVRGDQGKQLQARFTGVAGGGEKVYVARAAGQSRPFISLPFQLTATQGAGVNLIMAPPVLFAFHGGATLDDELLYFQLQMTLYNPSLVPYQPGPQGLRIPLAAGYQSASIEDEVGGNATPLMVDEDRGLVWRGALPAGQRQFLVGFGLPAEGGRATLDMKLPFGLWPSQMWFQQVPGFKVQRPPGVQEKKAKAQDGQALLLLEDLQARPGGSLKLTFTGLPQHPPWQSWVRLGVGVAVLGLLGWGVWGVAMRGRRGGGRQSSLEEEREELLDAVVQLEGELRRQRVTEQVYQQRRAELLRQLEGVYGELAAGREAESEAGRAETRATS